MLSATTYFLFIGGVVLAVNLYLHFSLPEAPEPDDVIDAKAAPGAKK